MIKRKNIVTKVFLAVLVCIVLIVVYFMIQPSEHSKEKQFLTAEELVQQADFIFTGELTSIRPYEDSKDIKLYNIRQEKSYKGYVHTEYMTIRKAGDLYVSGQVMSKVVIGGKYLFLAEKDPLPYPVFLNSSQSVYPLISDSSLHKINEIDTQDILSLLEE